MVFGPTIKERTKSEGHQNTKTDLQHYLQRQAIDTYQRCGNNVARGAESLPGFVCLLTLLK
jgi:hypothetical protein